MPAREETNIQAVLGPTNTGKTFLAIDRMLGHASGMMGFPLRLLARENYDRAVRVAGPAAVALVTGEERIVPPTARYFLCTVEAMPLDRAVEFLAIDEIQLCADPERGHVFTDRLLHARGMAETMFLGAETVAPLLRRLVPDVRIQRRERLSRLTYTGPRKLARLPPRSAVIAFSGADVYALAELVRRQRGGAAVVLGALSPRTRNAQVAMYEAGEVDYLVATDAIGMGLNMAIDHVAFAALAKFDGRNVRRLVPAEMAQIAGRAGRSMNDGTFGPTGTVPAFEPYLIEAMEQHRFETLKRLYWRSAALDFASPEALVASLEVPPPSEVLRRAGEGSDHLALVAALADPAVRPLVDSPATVRLLWDACQIPDFRKDFSDGHPRLVARVFDHLVRDRRIPEDWIARSLDRLDRTDGDIDTLVGRIAHVRTWTYVSHRPGWLDDSVGWQGRTRALEDKLSDALHERLTQRFVDRKTAALMRRLRAAIGGETEPLAAVTGDGRVVVEGEAIGRVEGFRFAAGEAPEGRLRSAANRVMREAVGGRVAALERAGDAELALDVSADGAGLVLWQGAGVARLVRGGAVLHPAVDVIASDLLDQRARERVRRCLQAWLDRYLACELAPLFRLEAAALGGVARGIAYRVVQGLGCAVREGRPGDDALPDKGPDRKALARAGVRLGTATLFLPNALGPRTAALRALLWSLQRDRPWPGPLPVRGALALSVDPSVPADWYLALGYRPAGPLAVRAEALERMLVEVRKLARQGPFVAVPALRTMIGADEANFAAVLRALGFRARLGEDGVNVGGPAAAGAKGGGGRPVRSPRRSTQPIDPDSPFAALARLRRAR